MKAAEQEEALTVKAPASLSAPQRVEFVRTFLKKYTLKIDVQIDPSGGSMVRKIAHVAMVRLDTLKIGRRPI